MVHEVRLPGLTSGMMLVLVFVATRPEGASLAEMLAGAGLRRSEAAVAARDLADLGWLVRESAVVYRASPAGARLAGVWEFVSGLSDASGRVSNQDPTGDPEEAGELVSVRVLGVRKELGLSQSAFARAMREAGDEIGIPNKCTKRAVQKYEADEYDSIRGDLDQALAVLTSRTKSAQDQRPRARPLLQRFTPNAQLEIPDSGGAVTAGWWLGSPMALVDLSNRVGQLSAELLNVQEELLRLSHAPVIGR